MNPYQTGYTPIPPVNPVVQAVKQSAASPVFLAVVITYSLSLVMKLITAFLPNVAAQELIYEIFGSTAIFSDALSIAQGSAQVASILALIPALLGTIGLWLIYSAGHKKDYGPMNTSGFVLVQILLIIRVVMIATITLLLAVVIIPLMVSLGQYSSYYSSYSYSSYSLYSTSMVLLGVVLFFLIVALIFCIIYYIKASRTTSLIKHAACGQLLPRRVSLFVIVINFILMAFCFLGAMTSLFTLSFFECLSSLLDGLFFLLLSIVLINLRNKLNLLSRPMVPPQGPGPNPQNPYGPQNAGDPFQPQ